MKLGHLAQNSFVTSFRKLMQQKVPVKTAFKLRGIAKSINDEITKYNETKEQIAIEHALKNDKGEVVHEKQGNQDGITIDPAKIPAFIKKMRELDEIEVLIPSMSIGELGKEGDLTLVPDDYFNLEFLTE